ncbi:MAG TPA: 23S rRNA (adenine(2503)-C(2))-methyltransferase RlmN [Terriglobales bacterium]
MNEPQQRELLSLSNQQLADLVESFSQAPYRLRQLLDGLYRQRWSRLDQFSILPLTFRQQLVDAHYSIGQPIIDKQFTSSDGTVRYLFAFADGQSIETVWMPEGDGGEAGDGSDSGDEELTYATPRSETAPSLQDASSPRDLSSRGRAATEGSAFTGNGQPATGNSSRTRATICVSSQVGCAVECAFCMTALLGLHRNLTAGEIVGQVLAVLNDQQVDIDRDRINLVFMGQGEPFLNYDNFMQAVRLLVSEVGIPASRMTVSTSGIVPRITDFGAEEVRPKLAVSLNAPNETLRTEVMPITRKWTIEKLLAALRDFPLRNRERLTFEYVLLGGLNDSPTHARELVELIRGLRAKVNLIALNPGPEIPFSMPEPERVLAFQSVLTAAGIPAFIRRPRGRDIYAACGQLKHTTELIHLS